MKIGEKATAFLRRKMEKFLTVPYNSYIMYADYKRKDAFYYGKRI